MVILNFELFAVLKLQISNIWKEYSVYIDLQKANFKCLEKFSSIHFADKEAER